MTLIIIYFLQSQLEEKVLTQDQEIKSQKSKIQTQDQEIIQQKLKNSAQDREIGQKANIVSI